MCNTKIQRDNIVAQKCYQIKTVPPGKRQSKGLGGFPCSSGSLKAACGSCGFPFEQLSGAGCEGRGWGELAEIITQPSPRESRVRSNGRQLVFGDKGRGQEGGGRERGLFLPFGTVKEELNCTVNSPKPSSVAIVMSHS